MRRLGVKTTVSTICSLSRGATREVVSSVRESGFRKNKKLQGKILINLSLWGLWDHIVGGQKVR